MSGNGKGFPLCSTALCATAASFICPCCWAAGTKKPEGFHRPVFFAKSDVWLSQLFNLSHNLLSQNVGVELRDKVVRAHFLDHGFVEYTTQ